MNIKKTGTKPSPLFHEDDIPEGESRGFQHHFQHRDHALFAIKKAGLIHCYRNQCPHIGLPLEWQEHQFLNTDRSLIQCSSHGALFRIEDGYCLSEPCPGQSLEKMKTQTQNGWVYIELENNN